MPQYSGTIVDQVLARPAVRKHEYIVTILFFALFVISLMSPPATSMLGVGFHTMYIFTCLAYAISLSFEAWTRTSRFRLSRNYPMIDNILSGANVILPFLYLPFGPLPLIISGLLMSYSYIVSPDRAENRTENHFGKRFYYFLMNSIFLSLISLSTGVLV